MLKREKRLGKVSIKNIFISREKKIFSAKIEIKIDDEDFFFFFISLKFAWMSNILKSNKTFFFLNFEVPIGFHFI